MAELFQVAAQEGLQVRRQPPLADLSNLVPNVESPSGSADTPELYMTDVYGFLNAEVKAATSDGEIGGLKSRRLYGMDPNSDEYQQIRSDLAEQFIQQNADTWGSRIPNITDNDIGLRNNYTRNERFTEFLADQTKDMDDASANLYMQKAMTIYRKEFELDLSKANVQIQKEVAKESTQIATYQNEAHIEASMRHAADADAEAISTMAELQARNLTLIGRDDPELDGDTDQAILSREYYLSVDVAEENKAGAYRAVLENIALANNAGRVAVYTQSEVDSAHTETAKEYQNMMLRYSGTMAYDATVNLFISQMHKNRAEEGLPRLSDAAARKEATEMVSTVGIQDLLDRTLAGFSESYPELAGYLDPEGGEDMVQNLVDLLDSKTKQASDEQDRVTVQTYEALDRRADTTMATYKGGGQSPNYAQAHTERNEIIAAQERGDITNDQKNRLLAKYSWVDNEDSKYTDEEKIDFERSIRKRFEEAILDNLNTNEWDGAAAGIYINGKQIPHSLWDEYTTKWTYHQKYIEVGNTYAALASGVRNQGDLVGLADKYDEVIVGLENGSIESVELGVASMQLYGIQQKLEADMRSGLNRGKNSEQAWAARGATTMTDLEDLTERNQATQDFDRQFGTYRRLDNNAQVLDSENMHRNAMLNGGYSEEMTDSILGSVGSHADARVRHTFENGTSGTWYSDGGRIVKTINGKEVIYYPGLFFEEAFDRSGNEEYRLIGSPEQVTTLVVQDGRYVLMSAIPERDPVTGDIINLSTFENDIEGLYFNTDFTQHIDGDYWPGDFSLSRTREEEEKMAIEYLESVVTWNRVSIQEDSAALAWLLDNPRPDPKRFVEERGSEIVTRTEVISAAALEAAGPSTRARLIGESETWVKNIEADGAFVLPYGQKIGDTLDVQMGHESELFKVFSGADANAIKQAYENGGQRSAWKMVSRIRPDVALPSWYIDYEKEVNETSSIDYY